MTHRLFAFAGAALLLAAVPEPAAAYGPKVVGITVSSDDGTKQQLSFTGDSTDNHLALERTGPNTLRVTVAAGEAIGLGDPAAADFAGGRCTRVNDETVDCSLAGIGEPAITGAFPPPSAIRVDLKGGTFDRFEVKGVDLGFVTTATSEAASTLFLGGNEVDRFFGGPGNDVIETGGGNDYLGSDGGDDTLRGGEGDDELEDRFGHNVLDGGPGSDLLRIRTNVFYDYIDPIEAADPASTCGDGDDLIYGLLPSEAMWPGCERRVGMVQTSELTPAGTAPVGRTLSVSSTTVGSPLQRTEIKWRRCPPLPTTEWACPIVATSATYTVTDDDLGFSILADGTSGWIGPGSRTIGFWFQRRTAVEPRPQPVPVPVPVPKPIIQEPVPPQPSTPPRPEPSAGQLAARVRTLFTGAGSTLLTDGKAIEANVPSTFGAPNGSKIRVTVRSIRAGKAKATTLGKREIVLTVKTRKLSVRLTAAGRRAFSRSRKQRVTLAVALTTPAGERGAVTGPVTLKRP